MRDGIADRVSRAEAFARDLREIQDKRAAPASALGSLNAAHASATARAHAAPNSRVGTIASYEAAVRQAQTIKDPVARQAALDRARAQLTSNKPVTPQVVERVDTLLGIDGN